MTAEKIDLTPYLEMRKQAREHIEQLEMSIGALEGVLLGSAYIVVMPGPLFADFDVVKGKAMYIGFKSNPAFVMRFTKRDAEAVALSLKNGNGSNGYAEHVNYALEQALIDAKNLYQRLDVYVTSNI